MKVFLIAAITADGFIARASDELADWTTPEDKQRFVKLTKEAGVMVMGSHTFDTIGRALPGRRNLIYTSRAAAYRDIAGIEIVSEPPRDLVARMEIEGATALAVLGGAQVYDQFMRAGIVTDLYINVMPRLFGRGITLLSDALEASLKLESVERLGSDGVALHYIVKQGDA